MDHDYHLVVFLFPCGSDEANVRAKRSSGVILEILAMEKEQIGAKKVIQDFNLTVIMLTMDHKL